MSRFVGSVAICLLLSGNPYAQDTRPYLTDADRKVSAALDETTEFDRFSPGNARAVVIGQTRNVHPEIVEFLKVLR